MRPLPGMYRHHWFRPHRWQTIIRDPDRPVVTQRCLRCGQYRRMKLSEHQQVKEMS